MLPHNGRHNGHGDGDAVATVARMAAPITTAFATIASGEALPGPGAHPVCPTRMAHLLGEPLGAFLHQVLRVSNMSQAMK